MKKAIGIDLGTTNSVVAFKDTSVKIIRNRENEELTRSCVGLRRGEMLVGSKAYLDIKRDPVNTIVSIKRLMGAAIRDKMVQDMIHSQYYQYGITSLKNGTEDSVCVVLGGKQFTPEEISAEILKKLKSDAEEKLGDEVTHAVITVPAYFTEKQKNATREAAQQAGLKVQKLLAEPTAAAIAYGVDNLKPGEAKTVLIYDFGGGTFDLSILNIVDGQYMEAGTGGDRWLGGDDLDRKLQEIVLNKVAEDYNIKDIKKLVDNLTDKKKFLFDAEIKNQTYDAKHQLSSAKSASIIIDNVLEDENGDIIDIDVTITREEFEKAITPFIERSIDLIGTLLREVGYDMTMIDNILLVGGTSCIPIIKQMLSDKYGSGKIKVSEKPMLAVAEGAAILAHRLGDEYEPVIGGLGAIDVPLCITNHNYYIEVADGDSFGMERVIEKQVPLPVEISKNFKTTTNNQKVVNVTIHADVEEGNHETQFLGFYLIEENLPIGSELTFDFKLDVNEIFSVSVFPKGEKKMARQIVLGRNYADQRALSTIDKLIEKSTKEFRTVDGEDDFIKFITQKIQEIDKIGATKVDDNKWHEVYYTTSEKFEQIKSTETGISIPRKIVYKAKQLVIEFGELLDTFDKNSIRTLITQIETSTDDSETNDLVDKLREKMDNYSLLNDTLQIESMAGRILEIPGSKVGTTNKQTDVARLNQISRDVKTKFKMHHISEGKVLLDEAYLIIDKYKIYF